MDPPVIPNGVQDRLVSIHAKLLQLVEGIAELERQIEYGGNQGMLPWQDILAKYSLFTSYTHSVFDLLVPPPHIAQTVEKHKTAITSEKPAYKTREEQRVQASLEAEAWKKTLVQSLVHPGKAIELDREFIVGILLRTKQIPEVEAQEAELLQTVPSTSEPAQLYRQLKAHDELADRATRACKRVREGVADREFNWKARVIDADDEDEIEPAKAPKYSNEAIGRFLREGILG